MDLVADRHLESIDLHDRCDLCLSIYIYSD